MIYTRLQLLLDQTKGRFGQQIKIGQEMPKELLHILGIQEATRNPRKALKFTLCLVSRLINLPDKGGGQLFGILNELCATFSYIPSSIRPVKHFFSDISLGSYQIEARGPHTHFKRKHLIVFAYISRSYQQNNNCQKWIFIAGKNSNKLNNEDCILTGKHGDTGRPVSQFVIELSHFIFCHWVFPSFFPLIFHFFSL